MSFFDIWDPNDEVTVPVEIAEPSLPEIGFGVPVFKPKSRALRFKEFSRVVDIPPVDSLADVLDDCPSVNTAELLGIDAEEYMENEKDSSEVYMTEKDATVPFDLKLLESTRPSNTENSRGTAK